MNLTPVEAWVRLRATYWFIPGATTAAGIGLAAVMLWVDGWLQLPADGRWSHLYPSSSEGARSLLSPIISSMVTVVSLTFSVTIVAITVASQHFGPRLLSTFMRDTPTQVVLGTFLATFAYAVLVLSAVPGDGEGSQVPTVAVLGAVALVIASLGGLIFYMHHVSRSMQVSTIADSIVADLEESLLRLAQDRARRPPAPDREPEPVPHVGYEVRSETAGYVQRLHEEGLFGLAERAGLTIWVRKVPGNYVISGTTLAVISPAEEGQGIASHVRALYGFGPDRTAWQDPESPLKQLVEVALRALSPGVNEPFTAIACIDRIGECLAHIAGQPPRGPHQRGRDGALRVVWRQPAFAGLLRSSFDPIRIFAGRNPAIPVRLFQITEALGERVSDPADRAALRHQIEVIHRSSISGLDDPDDRRYVEACYEAARSQLAT